MAGSRAALASQTQRPAQQQQLLRPARPSPLAGTRRPAPRASAAVPAAVAAPPARDDAPPAVSTSGRGTPSRPSGGRGAHVRVTDMVKHFKTRRGLFKAVDGVSIDMAPGTITALLGPSGSGKTTLLRLIAGLEEPTSGRVIFDGADMTDRAVQDRDLGVVFQGYALFKHMSVHENIKFGPRIRKMPGDLDAKAEALLRLTELEGFGPRFPPQLSGGQRQRVAVARALACDPRLLLLDEPFGALDPVVRKSLRAGLRRIVESVGVTTVIVTHDQEEAWDLADQVVIFNHGRVEQSGTPAEIASEPVSPFVMNFVGDVNYLPAGCMFLRKLGYATDRPFAMVRPGDVTMYKSFGEPYGCAATVADKVNVGWIVRYYLKFDDGVELELGVPRKQDELLYDLGIGTRVLVKADPHRIMGFDWPDIGGSPLGT